MPACGVAGMSVFCLLGRLHAFFHPVETTRCTDKREAWHGEADRRSPYTNVMSTDAENVALLHPKPSKLGVPLTNCP